MVKRGDVVKLVGETQIIRYGAAPAQIIEVLKDKEYHVYSVIGTMFQIAELLPCLFPVSMMEGRAMFKIV